ncbi:MAG: RDD family protein [Burkholderiales bacterium]
MPAVLDTARRVATPEGIEITLRVAGPVPRAFAYALDLVVRIAIMIVVSIAVSVLGRFGLAILLLTAFALEWLYPVVFEVLANGATPGKRAMGLRVLNDDGTPVRWPASLTRNLLRAIDFLPFMYFTGFCAMVANRDFKRLGDLAANTLVVYRDEKPAAGGIPQAAPITPLMPLSLSEQRTLLDFAERSGRITPERAAELAEIISPLAANKSGQEAVQHVVSIANHLAGRS